MDTTQQLETAYRRGNLEAAGVILENIVKYGGESAGLVMWARLVTSGETRVQRGLAARPKGEEGFELVSSG